MNTGLFGYDTAVANKDLRVEFYNSPINIAQCNPMFRSYFDTPGLEGRVKGYVHSMETRISRGYMPRERQQVILVPYGDKTPQRIFY